MGGEAATKRQSRTVGRLELTWANKDRRLLAHDDVTYEWVDPHDWRVSEVRLLDVVTSYGEDVEDNLLIQGDALHALTALTSVPEYAERYLGKVKLAYLDPPFNTGQTFQQYDDNLEHSVWLTMLRDRLEQIHRLLSDDGSVWLHLDDAEVHRARCVLDEVFGADRYVGTVTWRSSDNSNNDALGFSLDHNQILVYAKETGWRSNRLEATLDRLPHYGNPDDDPRGPWFDGNPVNSPSPRPNLRYTLTGPEGQTIEPPANGWRWERATMEAKFASGEIYFNASGTGIKRRTYLADHGGLPPSSLWTEVEVLRRDADGRPKKRSIPHGHNRGAKNHLKSLFGLKASDVFATPKPEQLLEKVIRVATDPDDLVLDCFAGSGTTAAVAHKMGRRWVTVELSAETVDTFLRPRLRKVVDGDDPGGITATVAWTGGGGFTEARVAPSMFEDVDGTVVLADWATNGQLAEAVAAQLRFGLEPAGPFVGRKGRTRLAVLDGMLTVGVADHLLDQLDERENLVVVAMTLEEGVAEHLRKQRPGSRARKVPRDLARPGKLTPRLVRFDRSKPKGEGQ